MNSWKIDARVFGYENVVNWGIVDNDTTPYQLFPFNI